jgi:hypothetical protein
MSRVVAGDQRPAVAEDGAAVGQQLLEVTLDPVLDQAGVDPEVVGGVVQDLPGWPHPNPDGHKRIATEIVELLPS